MVEGFEYNARNTGDHPSMSHLIVGSAERTPGSLWLLPGRIMLRFPIEIPHKGLSHLDIGYCVILTPTFVCFQVSPLT